MTYKFEKNVIDKILNIIKKNQLYLTQPENLPQLAKLGYMYNTLWYAGRVCWGYDGILRDSKRGNGQCEDNPKYKIEMCNSENDEIENLIYDAWGMHITMGENKETWDEFSKIILQGKELSDLQRKIIKENKTMDEWVDLMMDKNYPYSSMYKTKKQVFDYLLCVIGTGYGFKDGFVYKEASGAEQDISIYGDWENAKFRNDINSIVTDIMSIPEVESTIQAEYLYIKSILEKETLKKLEKDIKIFGMSFDDFCETPEYEKLINKRVKKYNKHYPICNYANISKIDENSHPSYIIAGLEVCEDIIEHREDEEQNNIEFAEQFINRFKK